MFLLHSLTTRLQWGNTALLLRSHNPANTRSTQGASWVRAAVTVKRENLPFTRSDVSAEARRSRGRRARAQESPRLVELSLNSDLLLWRRRVSYKCFSNYLILKFTLQILQTSQQQLVAAAGWATSKRRSPIKIPPFNNKRHEETSPSETSSQKERIPTSLLLALKC